MPPPIEVIDKMLELAEVEKGDVLYDLGSGDGRIVIRAMVSITAIPISRANSVPPENKTFNHS